jgi:hypothetical protein
MGLRKYTPSTVQLQISFIESMHHSFQSLRVFLRRLGKYYLFVYEEPEIIA